PCAFGAQDRAVEILGQTVPVLPVDAPAEVIGRTVSIDAQLHGLAQRLGQRRLLDGYSCCRFGGPSPALQTDDGLSLVLPYPKEEPEFIALKCNDSRFFACRRHETYCRRRDCIEMLLPPGEE